MWNNPALEHKVCVSCNKRFKTRKLMEQVLIVEDERQIGLFLAGVFNTYSMEKNIHLLFDGFAGAKIKKLLPEDVVRLCVVFCFNIDELGAKIQDCYRDTLFSLPEGNKMKGRVKLDQDTSIRIWNFRVKLDENQTNAKRGLYIGIYSTGTTVKGSKADYGFCIQNGKIASGDGELMINNGSRLGLVYVNTGNNTLEKWSGRMKLFIDDKKCEDIKEIEAECIASYRLQLEFSSDVSIEIVSTDDV